MSEEDLSEYDDLIEELDEVDEEKKKSIGKEGAKVSKNSSFDSSVLRLGKLGANETGLIKTSSDQGALSAGKPITASDISKLADGIMPQSPIVDNFIGKQINYRMSKNLDNMSKTLNITTNKSRMLNENDILIDDNLFDDEE